MNTNDHGELPIKYAVIEYVTLKSILNVYDALGIDRLLVELVSYDREQQKSLKRAIAYLPVGKAKLLCHVALGGHVHDGWKLESFGGGPRDGQIESRTLRVEYDTAQGRFAANPWRITIAMGAGIKNKQGGIQPDGQPHTQIAMRFGAEDFAIHLLEIRDYLQAHQTEIETVRMLAQLQHYETRQAAQKPKPPAKAEPAYGRKWGQGVS